MKKKKYVCTQKTGHTQKKKFQLIARNYEKEKTEREQKSGHTHKQKTSQRIARNYEKEKNSMCIYRINALPDFCYHCMFNFVLCYGTFFLFYHGVFNKEIM